ncbi:hypothetical protein [Frankia sp. EI5c]|uniref:hypothetical protein n=1 Tax=Frankia sp. EI5c TaxID=683316 RepID=UPI000FF89BD6|nr:hypothetical protein [Frankia sp. EI5c]
MKRLARSFVVVGCSLGIALSAGCGSGGEGVTVSAASVAQSGDPDAPCTTVDVPTKLAEMRVGKRELLATPPPIAGQPGTQIENAGDYAYASLPIDITGPGKYTIKVGPLDEGFDYPRNPTGFAFSTDGFAGQARPTGKPEMITDSDGKEYLQLEITVENSGPCKSFVMFVE